MRELGPDFDLMVGYFVSLVKVVLEIQKWIWCFSSWRGGHNLIDCFISNSALVSCQRGLHEAIISGETRRTTGMSLNAETLRTRSLFRYPMTNSHSNRCTSTSFIRRTRGRALKRHKRMDKRNLPVGLIRRRLITPLESSFCNFWSSHTVATFASSPLLIWSFFRLSKDYEC